MKDDLRVFSSVLRFNLIILIGVNMNKIRFAFALLCCLINCSLAKSDQPVSNKPNVLFFICDDLNCDLGCYGHPIVKSPNIDRLAQQGVRFANAFCQYPLCGPSRASLMTGLYPDQTRVQRNQLYIRNRLPDVKTLAQMFREQGYFSTRIGKIFHYNVPKHIGSGGHDDPDSWDYTINPRGRDKHEENKIFSVKPGEYGGYMSWLAADGTDEEQTDGIAASEAIRLIKQYAVQEQPFFLAVGLYRPHTPYVAPKKYFELYSTQEIPVPETPDGYLDTLPPLARVTLTKKKEHFNISPTLARQAMQAYYASISFADAQLGRVLDALKESGVARNTIIVFTSDHGYHMGEHGHWLKTTLFENAAQVPLIISAPGVNSNGHETNALAELVDLYPTLAELCAAPSPEYLAGVSLVPVLNNPRANPRSSAMTQLKNNYSIRTEEYRYTEWGVDGNGGNELYNRQDDPGEMTNLANSPSYRDTVDRLSQLLRERISAARQPPEGLKQIIEEH